MLGKPVHGKLQVGTTSSRLTILLPECNLSQLPAPETEIHVTRRVLSVCVLFLLVLVAALPHLTGARTFAASATPPAPPTFIPPTIGLPPGPPTPTSVTSPGATASPVVTATTVIGKRPSFSLQAARISKINSPADLRGLTAVRSGSRVWLMMYYTLWRMPKTTKRVSTYEVDYRGKTIFEVAFGGKFKAGETGRFSRYTVYAIPSSLPLGHYIFRVKLRVGSHTQTKLWPFSIARHDHVSTGVTGG